MSHVPSGIVAVLFSPLRLSSTSFGGEAVQAPVVITDRIATSAVNQRLKRLAQRCGKPATRIALPRLSRS
ncbi:MAG: hypothetical protein OES13_11810, partial [Acidimicrobiia bacterium]|nr:hypothetical protein [Acidimicrobiia bacterium]